MSVNLKESIVLLVETYLVEKTKYFTGNDLANHIRNAIPDLSLDQILIP